MSVHDLQLPALTAGCAILALCVIGGYAGITLESLVKTGSEDPSLDLVFNLRSTLVCFWATTVLDLIVSYALFLFFAPVNKHLSAIAALFRVAYVSVLSSNLPALNMSANLLESQAAGNEGGKLDHVVKGTLSSSLTEFNLSFNGTGLAFFGVHLFILGVIVFMQAWTSSSTLVPKWVAALLLVAGIGYTADSLDRMLEDPPRLNLTANGCFVGEAVFMVWLLVSAWNLKVVEIEDAADKGNLLDNAESTPP